MDNKISVVISTIKYNKNLIKTIKSINSQNYLPKEIIIVSHDKIYEQINLNKKIHLKKYISKIKNQVYQRDIGIKNLSKNSDLILQLDEGVILNNKCLFELNKFWKKGDKSLIGVGLNQTNVQKESGIINRFLKKSDLKGKVLKNGINIDYSNADKDLEVMWLKGGISSWKIKKKKMKNRKYPFWKWSVYEDVEISLSKDKKQKLFVCHKAKAKIIKKNKLDFENLIYRGSLHTFSQKDIVKKFFNDMTFFYLTVPFFIFFSLVISVLTLNYSKFIYNLGRFKGFFIIDFN